MPFQSGCFSLQFGMFSSLASRWHHHAFWSICQVLGVFRPMVPQSLLPKLLLRLRLLFQLLRVLRRLRLLPTLFTKSAHFFSTSSCILVHFSSGIILTFRFFACCSWVLRHRRLQCSTF